MIALGDNRKAGMFTLQFQQWRDLLYRLTLIIYCHLSRPAPAFMAELSLNRDAKLHQSVTSEACNNLSPQDA